jgi:hypothetical protein
LFLEKIKTSFEDFYDAAYKVAPKEMLSIPLIQGHLDDILETRENERHEETIASEYDSVATISSASIYDDNGYDYSTIDENSVEGDDSLDNYDLEEFDLVEDSDE